jgi:hypothetical protein
MPAFYKGYCDAEIAALVKLRDRPLRRKGIDDYTH